MAVQDPEWVLPDDSTASLHSLRDIPCVDQTLDSGFVSDRFSISLQSTPYLSTPQRKALEYQPQVSFLSSQDAQSEDPNATSEPLGQPPRLQPPTPPKDRSHVDDLRRLHEAADNLQRRLVSWGATAHAVVIGAAGMGRAVNGLAAAVSSIGPSFGADPQTFAAHFHSIRDHYGPLLDSAPVPQRTSPFGEIAWERRQLIESFVTLLRTSPGFLGSCITHLTPAEVGAFCAGGDSSPLAILFHDLWGSSSTPDQRAACCSELVTSVRLETYRRTLCLALLDRILFVQTRGYFTAERREAAEHSLKLAVANRLDSTINSLVKALLPPEFGVFAALLPPELDDLVQERVREYTSKVLTAPHRWGLMVNTYLSEPQRRSLAEMASLLEWTAPSPAPQEVLWQADELVALKGADLTALFHALLPSSVPSSQIDDEEDPEDEWCLDNIRTDLLPVARELTHTPGLASSWFVFRIGADGLASEFRVESNVDGTGADVEAADAVSAALGAGKSLVVALENAEARADRIAVFQLQEALQNPLGAVDSACLREERRVQALRDQYKALQRVLDASVATLHLRSERIRSLLDILDAARLHVWYEHEARLSTPFIRARTLVTQLYADPDDSGSNSSAASAGASGTGSARSRRLSLLSSSYAPDPVLLSGLGRPKLVDKEVDIVALFMRRHRVPNLCPAEELVHRFHAEVALLAKRLVDRDALASSSSFRRDLHTHNSHMNHRRSSLGLFDLFETTPPPPPPQNVNVKVPTLQDVTALVLSDFGYHATDTDRFMSATGRMLLEGDASDYEAALDDVSLETDPQAKLHRFEVLVRLVQARNHDMGRCLGRNGGQLFSDLQAVAAHVSPLPSWFGNIAAAARGLLDSVCLRAMDLADRMLRYHLETRVRASVVASVGISDGVTIWAFCARMGRPEACRRLAELYRDHDHTSLELRPLSHAGSITEGDNCTVREAVIRHWIRDEVFI